MSKYVKLGPAAAQGSFYDPVTKLNLTPGVVAKTPKLAKTSQVFQTALKGQHIVAATEEEFEEYEESLAAKKAEEAEKPSKKEKPAKKSKPEPEDDEDEDDEDGEAGEDTGEDDDEDADDDEDDVDSMSKSELVDYLKSSNMPEEEKKNLSKMNKEALKAAFVQYTTKK